MRHLVEARDFLATRYATDASYWPEAFVTRMLEDSYPGGAAEFERLASLADETFAKVVPKSEEWSPVKVRLKCASMLGQRTLAEYVEVIAFTFEENFIQFTLSAPAKITHRLRSDLVEGRKLVLYRFERDDFYSPWRSDSVEVEEQITELHHKFPVYTKEK